MARTCAVAGGLLAAAAAVALATAQPTLGEGAGGAPAATSESGLVSNGRTLFEEGCSSCHGLDGTGRPGLGPDLTEAGARAADFYLTTGRMPLANPGDEPLRASPRYERDEIDAIAAFVGSLGGPPVPPAPTGGDVAEGLTAFTEYCAGCHQVVARGGVVTGAAAPSLAEATPTQVAEAVRIGPYLMPKFGPDVIDDRTLSSIAAYVEQTKDPDDRGGWGIGNLGPVPEGMVAWLIAIAALLLVARAIGERAGGRRPDR